MCDMIHIQDAVLHETALVGIFYFDSECRAFTRMIQPKKLPMSHILAYLSTFRLSEVVLSLNVFFD